MSGHIAEEDDEDDEEPDYDALLDDEGSTVPCPYCQKPIPEDTPRCPYCGNYLSDEDAPTPKKPLWIILTAILTLIVLVFWLLR